MIDGINCYQVAYNVEILFLYFEHKIFPNWHKETTEHE